MNTVATKLRWKGSIILLRMLQHRLHAVRAMRGLERLNSEQGKGGIESNPLALLDCVIDFVLQSKSTISPHSDDTTPVVPFSVRAVRIVSDVDRVINRGGDLDFRSFARIKRAKALFLNCLMNGSCGVTDV